MPIEHVLRDTDTLKSLADTHLGDSQRWMEIAEFNRISPPYLVDDPKDKEALLYGSGYVVAVRSNYQTGLTVREGWTFKTNPYLIGGHVKVFRVTEDVYVPPGVAQFTVHARSVVPGQYGNIGENIINVAGEAFLEHGVQIDSCTNPEKFEGGRDTRILASGDTIYIPSERNELPPEDIQKMLDFIGGEDLELNENGMLYEDGFGDLASVSGVDNIRQAINDRLMTERGDLPLHPEYGTNVPSIIGKPQSGYTNKMIELDIYESLSYEDRITDVTILSVRIEGTTVHLDLSFRLSGIGRYVREQSTLRYLNAV